MSLPRIALLPPSSPSLARLKSHINAPTATSSFLPGFLRPATTYLNPWPSHRSPLNATTLANAFHDPASDPDPDDLAFERAQGWGRNGSGEDHPVKMHERVAFESDPSSPSKATGSKDGPSARAMWIGHASFWLEFTGGNRGDVREKMTLLLDPVFERRCSPSEWVGPVRDVQAPCSVEDLPVSQKTFVY